MSTALSMTVNGASPAVCTAVVSDDGPSNTVRWAMPAAIIRAASTNAAMAHTKRTKNTLPGRRIGHAQATASTLHHSETDLGAVTERAAPQGARRMSVS